MREIYFDRREFDLKGKFSVNKTGLTPLVHPEMYLTNKIKNYFYPTNFADNIPSKIHVFCGMLLTDNIHDGVWLIEDDRNGSLSIPGMFITESRWSSGYENPWRLIHKTFLDALKDLHPYLRDDIDPALQDIGPWVKSNNYYIGDMITYAIHKYGVEFTTETMVKDGPMYFLYKEGLGIHSDSSTDFMIFQVWELNKPDGHIPALMSLQCGNLMWYSRQDHVYNLQERGPRNRLFSGFKDDIRTSERGITLLDSIFRTETIFGKLSIY